MLKFPRKNKINTVVALLISSLIAGCAIPKEETKEKDYQYHPGAQIFPGKIIKIQTVFSNDYVQSTNFKQHFLKDSNNNGKYYHKKYNPNNEPPHIFINTSIIDSELENELLEQQKILKTPLNYSDEADNNENESLNFREKQQATATLLKETHHEYSSESSEKKSSFKSPKTFLMPTKNKFDLPMIESGAKNPKITHTFTPDYSFTNETFLHNKQKPRHSITTNLDNDAITSNHANKSQISEQQFIHNMHKHGQSYTNNYDSNYSKNCTQIVPSMSYEPNFRENKISAQEILNNNNQMMFFIVNPEISNKLQILFQNEQQYKYIFDTRFSASSIDKNNFEARFTKNASAHERSKFMLKITVKLNNGKIMNFIEPTDFPFKLMEDVRVVSQDNNQWLLVR